MGGLKIVEMSWIVPPAKSTVVWMMRKDLGSHESALLDFFQAPVTLDGFLGLRQFWRRFYICVERPIALLGWLLLLQFFDRCIGRL